MYAVMPKKITRQSKVRGRLLAGQKHFKNPALLAAFTITALVGIYVVARILAANLASFEAEGSLTGTIAVKADSSASGGQYIQFGATNGSTTPPQPPAQPPPPPIAPPPVAPPPIAPPPQPPPYSGSGNFGGTITRDGAPLVGVTVKVLNTAPPGWPNSSVLDSNGGCGGLGAPNCYLTSTDGAGNWGVTTDANTRYMLKIFPPSLCDALADTPAQYTTGDSGYINSSGNPFHSTADAPAGDVYNIYGSRYLLDMPVHVYPSAQFAGSSLDGNMHYSDLNVAFSTRHGSFSTSGGTQTCP
jgi:hypothetical protein